MLGMALYLGGGALYFAIRGVGSASVDDRGIWMDIFYFIPNFVLPVPLMVAAILSLRIGLLPYAGRVDSRGVKVPSFLGSRQASWDEIRGFEKIEIRRISIVRFHLKAPKPQWLWAKTIIQLDATDSGLFVYLATRHPELVGSPSMGEPGQTAAKKASQQ